ncbi:hypothetical protein FXN63_09700 [Pigmentiphaga aceris]|uniref:Uncharacterized protein n=1 Tax=Pigmentiphaga aceris TaxID=1940612 RepID=A0A5C0AUI1_9BURK|nr:hypothetical protein [Pigmentiphaga aceris]QEI06079.1 hypothetical protein FXN63_09700 [Pigmentiphaga aceris]
MSNKSLAQLEIGSPEWIAKRQTLLGNPPNPGRKAEPAPSLLALGALAIVVGTVFMTAVRFGAMLGRHQQSNENPRA